MPVKTKSIRLKNKMLPKFIKDPQEIQRLVLAMRNKHPLCYAMYELNMKFGNKNITGLMIFDDGWEFEMDLTQGNGEAFKSEVQKLLQHPLTIP
jgi:hypothetical protein